MMRARRPAAGPGAPRERRPHRLAAAGASLPAAVAVRDSKNPEGEALAFSPRERRVFPESSASSTLVSRNSGAAAGQLALPG